jgi:putative ABC transport system substrate-binding protein
MTARAPGLSRRRFVAGGAALICAPAAVAAQPAGKLYRVGVLGTTSPRTHGQFVDAFREALRDRGYVEGRNVTLEYRWAESDYARLPALATELAEMPVDLILTHGTPGAQAAKGATTTIPIVVAVTGDALTTGLVKSLARPGGNLTGLSFSFPEVNAKRIEILTEALPGLKRVAALMNGKNRGNVATVEAMARLARPLGVEVRQVTASTPDEFDAVFAQIARSSEAVCVYEDAFFLAEKARLAGLAEKNRLRSIGFREYAEAGGLLGFGVNFPEMWRRAAGFADRIFKGAKPGDLPVEQPTKYDTVVNLRTARALRVTISRTLLLRAETVIDQ